MVPKELRNGIILSCHNAPTSAHGGIAKTLEKIRRYFYWPGLVKDVRDYVGNCELFRTSKTPTHILRPPLGQITRTDRPFQRLYMDLIGPLPRTKSGNMGILIILDHFSKFTFLKPLKKLISKDIINYIRIEIFTCYGVPQVIVTDNGSQFRSRDFEEFLRERGIQHLLTAVYSPQVNASERVNRSINEALRSYIRKDQREWDIYISSINCALRNSVHQSVNKTPYQIVFGQTMLTHGQDYKLLTNLGLMTDSEITINRQDEFALIRQEIMCLIEKSYNKNARIYNLRSRNIEFTVGQEVIRRNYSNSSKVDSYNSKLAPVGVKVLKRIGQVNYELRDVDSENTGVYHAKDIWT